MYQLIPKLPIPPGKPKHNASSKGDLIEPTKAIQGKKGGTHKNPRRQRRQVFAHLTEWSFCMFFWRGFKGPKILINNQPA